MLKKFTDWTLEDRQFIREICYNCLKLEKINANPLIEEKKLKHTVNRFDNSLYKFYNRNKKLFIEGEKLISKTNIQIFSPISAAIPHEKLLIKNIPCLSGSWSVSYLPFIHHWDRSLYKRSTWGGACLIVNDNIGHKQLDSLEWILYYIPVNGMLGVFNPEAVGDVNKLPRDMKYKVPNNITLPEQKWVYNIQNTFVENPGLGIINTSHMCVFQTPEKNPRFYFLGTKDNIACGIFFPSLF